MRLTPLFSHSKILFPIVVSSALLAADPAQAAEVTWTGLSGTTWNNTSNWSTGTVPTTGDSLVFGPAGAAGINATSGVSLSDDISTLTVGGNGTVGITFGANSSSYTIAKASTQSITLASSGGANGITDNSLLAQTISVPLVLGSTQTINVANTLGSLTLSGAISGAGFGITKTGNGLLTLATTNTFTGPITFGAGTLAMSSPNNIGSASSLIFDGGAFRATNNITTSKAITINAGKTAVFDVNGAKTLALTGAIGATTGGLTLTNSGTLALSGANLYTGNTTINEGTLILNFAATGAPVSNIISSNSTLVMGGQSTALHNNQSVAFNTPNAFLVMTGSANASNTQTVNGLTLNQGYSSISVASGAGGSATLNLGAITANAGGVVTFTLPSTGKITTTTNNTNGILGGWALVGGTTWAANDGSGNIVAYTGYTTISSGAAIASNAASNVAITTAASGSSGMAASGVTDINTLQLNGNNLYTVNIGAGNTLRLGANGGIFFAGTTSGTISGGTLTAGGAANTAGEIVVHAMNLPTINSVIADNGTGVVSVTYNGNYSGGGESISVGGANTYSGGTYINSAKVSAGNVKAFGVGTVNVLYSGCAVLSTAGTYANNFSIGGVGTAVTNQTGQIAISATTGMVTLGGTITLQNDARISLGTGSASVTGNITGKITGNYGLEFTGATNGSTPSGTIILSNTGNDFTGGLGIEGGILYVSQGYTNSTNVTVKLGASEVISNGAGMGNVTIYSGYTTGVGTLDMNGYDETINGLVGGTGAALTGNTGVVGAFVTNNASGSGTSTLKLGDGNATASFGGIIKDGSTAKVAITKIGTGTQTFWGANTYTGVTTVENGTLAVALSGSISPTVVLGKSGATRGMLDVSAKAGYSLTNLSGDGTVNLGAGQTLTATGDVAPGFNGVAGTLNVAGNFTLAGTAATALEIGGANAGQFDIVNATGALTLGGSLVVASMNSFDLTQDNSFALFIGTSYSGDFSSVTVNGVSLAEISGIWSGKDASAVYTFNDSTGVLDIMAVPEPSTWAMVVGGLGMLFMGRKIRRRTV